MPLNETDSTIGINPLLSKPPTHPQMVSSLHRAARTHTHSRTLVPHRDKEAVTTSTEVENSSMEAVTSTGNKHKLETHTLSSISTVNKSSMLAVDKDTLEEVISGLN